MATAALTVLEPKSLIRPTHWSKEVENAYRFQLAGYRDELEYKRIRQVAEVCPFNFLRNSYFNLLLNRSIYGLIVVSSRNYNVVKMDVFIISINFANVRIKKSINVKYILIKKNKKIFLM
jgi:hypothetical protein